MKEELEMDNGILGLLLTIIVFGAIGWSLARKRQRPAVPAAFLILIGAAIIGYFVGVNTRLLDVKGFIVPLNWAIVACCLGGVWGLFAHNLGLRQNGGN
jgi:hypothetical protein